MNTITRAPWGVYKSKFLSIGRRKWTVRSENDGKEVAIVKRIEDASNISAVPKMRTLLELAIPLLDRPDSKLGQQVAQESRDLLHDVDLFAKDLGWNPMPRDQLSFSEALIEGFSRLDKNTQAIIIRIMAGIHEKDKKPEASDVFGLQAWYDLAERVLLEGVSPRKGEE